MHEPIVTIGNGIVTIENPTGDHFYPSWKDSRPLVSVTTFTDVYPKGYGFKSWLGNKSSFKEAEEEKEAAGRRGDRVHDACEDILRGHKVTYETYALDCPNLLQAIDEWENMVVPFVKWKRKYNPRMIYIVHKRVIKKDLAIEVEVQSEEHSYGGKFDLACVIELKGQNYLFIIDFKTGKKIYENYWLQINAYDMAAEECGIFKDIKLPRKLGILRLGTLHKDKYEFAVKDPDEDARIDFLACQRIWHRENPKIKGPTIIQFESEFKLDVPTFNT